MQTPIGKILYLHFKDFIEIPQLSITCGIFQFEWQNRNRIEGLIVYFSGNIIYFAAKTQKYRDFLGVYEFD